MKKVASSLAKKISIALVTLLVLCAVLVGVVRELVYHIGEFKPELVDFINTKSGMRLTIDSVSGSWRGLAPRFVFKNTRLHSSGNSVQLFYANAIDIEILLVRSILNLQLRFRLNIDGAEIHLVHQDGRLQLQGFTANETQSPEKIEKLVDFVSVQPRIAISNSELTVDGLYPQQIDLHVHQLQSESGLQRRFLRGYVTASGPSELSFRLVGRISGSLSKDNDVSGNVYLDCEPADWFPWVPAERRRLIQADLESVKGGGRFWIKIKRGTLAEIVSDIRASNVRLVSENEVQPPQIESLSGKLRWTGRLHDEWKLELQDLMMKTKSFTWRPNRLSLFAQQQTHDSELYRISVDDVDIEPWVKYYLGIQGKDSEIYNTVSKLRPTGKVQDLNLELLVKNNQLADYRYGLSLLAFESRPWKKFPGFHDVDVKAWGKKDFFLFKLDDDFAELDYPYLFRDILQINKLHGNLLLQMDELGFNLQSNAIQASTPYAKGAVQLSLSLPKDKAVSPFLQLQATLRDGDASKTPLYLPAGILDDKFVGWLDQALQGGHLLRGDIIAHGPIRKGTGEKRTLLLGFTGEEGVFQFLPDWKEPIREGLVDVIVDRGAVEAHALSGTYFDQKIVGASVILPRKKAGLPHVLSVRGKTKGQAETGYKVLRDTPIAGYLGGFIENLSMTGELDVDLHLDASLNNSTKAADNNTTEDVPPLSVNTRVTLKNGSLKMADQNLQVEDLSGEVEFDLNKGLQAQTLKGRLFGGPLLGEITTTQQESGRQIQLNVTGKAQLQQIKAWKPLSVLQPVSGAVDYQFGLYLPLGEMAKKQPKYFQVYSGLKGVRVDLPPPFAKQPGASTHFSLRMNLDHTPSELQLQYGESFSAILQSEASQIKAGMLRFGPGSVSLPANGRLVVQGVLPEFDDEQWRLSFNRVMNESKKQDEQVNSSVLQMVDDSALRIERLRLGGTDYGLTDISVRRTNVGWKTWIDNNRISGVAELPLYLLQSPQSFASRNQPVKVNLNRVQIPKVEEDNTKPKPEWKPLDLSPKSFPPLNLNINELQVGDANFGQWQIKMVPSTEGMQFTEVKSHARGLTLAGVGNWNETPQGNRYTSLNAHVQGDDVADVMRIWGVEPTLTSKSAKADIQVGWPGAPIELAVARMKGAIQLKLESGVFRNVSSNAAEKLWGALNFETLIRRLQLNFDDLRESEMVYNEIVGDLTLNRGLLDLKSIVIDSPSIKMNASGTVNMDPSQLNIGLDVTLPVTRNLILPAAVIGGVPAAAIAFGVEKMLGSQFDKLTTIKYAVEGSIEEPKISVKDSFSIIPKQVGEAVLGNEKSTPAAPPVEKQELTEPGQIFKPATVEPTPNLYQLPAPQKAPE